MTPSHDVDPPSSASEGFWNRGLAHAFRQPPNDQPEDGPSIETTGYCGRYKLGDEIARGGIGVVYRALDESLQREVAVKVLRKTLARNDGMIRRFLKEAQISSNLQHPGIVPVYEMGMALGDRPFFSMKLIEGRTLAAVLSDPGSSGGRVRALGTFEQVCQTLAFAHDRRVIHRDLKPGNIMVGAFGEVQVVDWGFAKALDGLPERPALAGERAVMLSGGSSIAGSVLGTPGYMPPEQARGAIQDLDERADVYALGAILAELLTGQRVRADRESASVEDAVHAAGNETRALLRRSEADPDLVDLALRCLSPAPDGRPRDASVVAAAISSYLADIERQTLDAAVEAAEARGRAEEERNSHRLAMAVSYLILVAVILGAGILWGLDSARRQELERTNRSIRFAVVEASAYLARNDLTEASNALERARGLTTPETDRAVQRELRRVDRMFESARLARDAREAKRRADIALTLRLRTIAETPASRAADHRSVLDDYTSTLNGTSYELGRLGEVEHTPISAGLLEVLIPALDDGLARAQVIGDSARTSSFLRALQRIDPNPLRMALRRQPLSTGVATKGPANAHRTNPLTAFTIALRLRAAGLRDGERIAIEASDVHLSHRGLHDLAVRFLVDGAQADSQGDQPDSERVLRALHHATVSAAIEEDVVSLRALQRLMMKVGRTAEADRLERRLATLEKAR